MALTQKKKDFCRAKLDGKSNKEAAVLAGYSERSAGAKGSQLADDPDVIAYLAALLNSGGGGVDATPLGEAAIQADFQEMESVTNSLEFLRSVYKNARLDRKTRIEAAKAALPYEFGKVVELGKKQTKKEKAEEAAKSGKFATLENQLRN